MNRAVSTGLKTTNSIIVLRDLPRTALVSDVRRLLVKQKVENVQNVHRGYYRFQRNGNAYITMSVPSQTDMVVKQLEKAQMSGYSVNVTSTSQLENVTRRSRGNKGRQEAANRGIITGTGPDAGITERGKGVVIWGLPGSWSEDAVRGFLERKGLRLADNDTDRLNVVKVEPVGRPSLTSRHYARMESVSEAHRLVRLLHMNSYQRRGAKNFMVHAQVVY
ncbi:hypothetical protein Clacol_006382 [Clathrus columnatus]|uniref:Uncharacterized protein n=1 Tax=Clathrus columnatus TaxID=1419009 RepID=A0AAV5AI32_9AGAM|nr:hypothetical protein Clacol_006382 [Clathrus columnatus]